MRSRTSSLCLPHPSECRDERPGPPLWVHPEGGGGREEERGREGREERGSEKERGKEGREGERIDSVQSAIH